MTRFIAVGVVLVAMPILAQQIPTRDVGAAIAPAGNATLAGAVLTSAPDDQPVRRATITIAGGGLRGQRTTVTNDQGQFVLTGLPAGHYSLVASKAGWVSAYYGSTHPGRPAYGGQSLMLEAGQRLADVVLHMLHGSAITGAVLDPFARPAQGVRVELLAVHVTNGQRRLLPVAGVASDTTDDRGAYRLFDVPPCSYVVAASPNDLNWAVGNVRRLTPEGLRAALNPTATAPNAASSTSSPAMSPPTVNYVPVYYPGTVDPADAVAIVVGAGEERASVDLPLQLASAVQLDGVLTTPDGQRPMAGQIKLVSRGSASPEEFLAATNIVRLAPDGTFTINGVAPGQYTLVARATERSEIPSASGSSAATNVGRGASPATKPLWATEDVVVTGEVQAHVPLALREGMTIAGHLSFGGAVSAPAAVARMRVLLLPTSGPAAIIGETPTAQVDAAGAFRFEGVLPGRYGVTAEPATLAGSDGGASKAWTLRSILVAGHDTLDAPLDIRPAENVSDLVVNFTDQPTELAGSLLDANGKPASEFRTVVFSADRAFWVIGGRRSPPPLALDHDGKFRVTGLPPGDYFIAAVTDIDPGDLRDPSVMEEMVASSVRLTLAEGEKKLQDLRIR